VWPAAADDLLPARFASAAEEDAATVDAAMADADGSPDDAGWRQKLLKSLPFN
jgi:hypothetical protein